MSKVTTNQLSKTLKALTGNQWFQHCKTYEGILDTLSECENFVVPFCVDQDVTISETRLMVYNHKMYKSKSALYEQLMALYEEILLVVDAVLPAKEALHFVTLTSSVSTVAEWFSHMQSHNITVRQVERDSTTGVNDYIVIAPLTSFLKYADET